jgi:D-aminopeptidase
MLLALLPPLTPPHRTDAWVVQPTHFTSPAIGYSGRRRDPAFGVDSLSLTQPGNGAPTATASASTPTPVALISPLTGDITTIPGVMVGQVTLQSDSPVPIRTGVTAVVPNATQLTGGRGNLANTGFRASGVALNGNGEMTGLHWVNTYGLLNGPIILTNTRAVGQAVEGVNQYFERYFPGEWASDLPVVGECWDGVFNTIHHPVVTPEHIIQAIDSARSVPVAQGRAGAGTGMRSFGMHAGIGSAATAVTLSDGSRYSLGVLLNANHSRRLQMTPDFQNQLEQRLGKPLLSYDTSPQAIGSLIPRQGSCVVIIATDAPLSSHQLNMLAQRAGLGLARTGSSLSTTSGDFVLAFSTANPVDLSPHHSVQAPTVELNPDELNPFYEAVIHTVIAAQANAMVAANQTSPRVPLTPPSDIHSNTRVRH